MSYLAFDLDALKLVPDTARAADVPEAVIGYGLLRLWGFCWTAKVEHVEGSHLRGFFQAPDYQLITDALCAFGFLERQPNRFRVRGAERYLRVRKARSEGAKKTNEKRWSEVAKPPQEIAPASLERQLSDQQPSPPVALTPSSEQRAPNTEHRAAIVVPLPKKPENRFESGDAYFAWLQHERHAAGFVTEKPPAGLGAWFSEVMLELNGDGERLDATVRAFAKDAFWRQRNAPMRGLMAKWRDYVPRAVAS